MQLKNYDFTFKQDNLINEPIKRNYSKLIFIQVNITYKSTIVSDSMAKQS